MAHTNAKGSQRPEHQAFDRSLRDRNRTWGLRDLEAVAAAAQSVGFSVPTITEMPANNLSVVFRGIPQLAIRRLRNAICWPPR
jgi:Protein of unknown function (DUF938)